MNTSDTTITKQRPWWHKWIRNAIDTSVLDHDELIGEIRQSQENNIISSESLGMLEGVMQVDKLQVRDIMIPRSNIRFIQSNDSFHEILKIRLYWMLVTHVIRCLMMIKTMLKVYC